MRSAVLVIDMQNGFVHERGSLPSQGGRQLPDLPRVIAENAAMIARARELDVPVIYTRHVFRPGFPEVIQPRQHGRLPLHAQPLLRGSWDAAIIDELKEADGDVVIDKSRYDAFLNTDLDTVLHGLGVEQILVSGVLTQMCVESTVRTGHQRDYEMMVAADCCSAPPQFHQASLDVMAHAFADVADWRTLMAERVEPDLLPALD